MLSNRPAIWSLILRRFWPALFFIAALHSYAQSIEQSLEFKRCTISSQAIELDAECATFTRPENPNDPDSRLIDLSVIKLSSWSPRPEPDAFTVIQGGPGASSIDLILGYSLVFDEIRKKRDIIVLDQRGTGRSNRLACSLGEDQGAQFDPALARQLAKACVEELSNNNDLRFYTTSIAVDDLEALRQASGYSQLNLYGTSYGTRVAQHYLRKYPKHTRSVVLDAVAPVGMNLAGGEIARRWEDSFIALNERCQQDAVCENIHGNLLESYRATQDRLAKEPISIEVPHPTSGKLTLVNLNEYSLLSALRLMAYSSEQRALMPLLLSQARQGDYRFLAAQLLQLQVMLQGSMAVGMHNAILCSEDAPFVTAQDQQRAKGTLFGETLSETLVAMCQVWPKGVVDQGFHQPFTSDVPVLLLSGETDPITPPANGETAAAMLGNGRHIVVPGQGHGVVMRGCMPKLVSLFIQDADLEAIDPSCIEREKPQPFFHSSSGPQP